MLVVMGALHEHLRTVCIRRPEDYVPWGERERQQGEEWLPDCSAGCSHFHPLEGEVRYDWGVCSNLASHRVGLLTFEHQGCEHFEAEECPGGAGDEAPAP